MTQGAIPRESSSISGGTVRSASLRRFSHSSRSLLDIESLSDTDIQWPGHPRPGTQPDPGAGFVVAVVETAQPLSADEQVAGPGHGILH